MPAPQSYSNHIRFNPLFHFVAQPILLLANIAAFSNLVLQFGAEGGFRALLPHLVLALLAVGAILVAIAARLNGLVLQDRLIMTEVAFRYHRLSGRYLEDLPIPPNKKQLIALRFASDEELVALTEKATSEAMAPDAIKRAVKNWRADHQRI